jgi:hypothetical protein
MKRPILILIFLISIIIAIILPFCLREKTESLNATLNLTATIISSIAAILTFIVALVLFDKYGIEASLLEKNTTAVFTLLEEIKLNRFYVHGPRFALNIEMHNPYFPHLEVYYSEKLLFPSEYYNGLNKLLSISASPFMPKSIAEKTKKLQFSVLTFDVRKEDFDQYSVVNISGQPNVNGEYGRFNNEDMTLFQFMNIIGDIKTEVINWIKDHSSYSADLNL